MKFQDNTYFCFTSKCHKECNSIENYEERENCCDKCKGILFNQENLFKLMFC